MGVPNCLNEHNYFPHFCRHEKESAVEQRWNGQCACQRSQVVSDGNHGSTTTNGESPCQLIKQGVQVLAVQARVICGLYRQALVWLVGAVGIEFATPLYKDLHGNDLAPLPLFNRC